MPDDPIQDLRIPHGVADLFFGQAAAKTELERILQETFQRWGYTRIIPPTIEYYDTVATQASPQLQEEMFRFFDREGRVLALRPDMTVGTARIVGTRLYDQLLPLRFYYVGSVFRYVEPQAGRHREFSQAGIELIGAGTAEADVEAIALCVRVLRALQLPAFQINLGQVGFLQAILSNSRLANGAVRRLEQAIDRRNDLELQEVLAELGADAAATRAIRAIPHLCGDEGILLEARKLAPTSAATEAIDHLARVYALLGIEGVQGQVILDLGEIRSMAYYTGVTFHGYAAGMGFPICSGGRYDGLLASFGADMPAIGFALSLERIMLLTQMAASTAPDVVFQACDHLECRAMAALARDNGLRVEMDVLGRKDEGLISYAQQRGSRAVCCGDGELFVLVDGKGRRSVTGEELVREMERWIG